MTLYHFYFFVSLIIHHNSDHQIAALDIFSDSAEVSRCVAVFFRATGQGRATLETQHLVATVAVRTTKC